MIWAFAIGLAFVRFNFITVILIVYGIVYPILVLYFLQKRVHAKTDPAIFRTRKLILREGVLETHFTDGTMSPVQTGKIWRIYKKHRYSLAYTSKHQFVYIPREGFLSKAEYEIFIKSLLS
jgi:membrane protein implicated in regulation of membrane protease activity